MAFTTGLYIYHTKITLRNQTTKEEIKKIYGGPMGNPYWRNIFRNIMNTIFPKLAYPDALEKLRRNREIYQKDIPMVEIKKPEEKKKSTEFQIAPYIPNDENKEGVDNSFDNNSNANYKGNLGKNEDKKTYIEKDSCLTDVSNDQKTNNACIGMDKIKESDEMMEEENENISNHNNIYNGEHHLDKSDANLSERDPLRKGIEGNKKGDFQKSPIKLKTQRKNTFEVYSKKDGSVLKGNNQRKHTYEGHSKKDEVDLTNRKYFDTHHNYELDLNEVKIEFHESEGMENIPIPSSPNKLGALANISNSKQNINNMNLRSSSASFQDNKCLTDENVKKVQEMQKIRSINQTRKNIKVKEKNSDKVNNTEPNKVSF